MSPYAVIPAKVGDADRGDGEAVAVTSNGLVGLRAANPSAEPVAAFGIGG